MADSYTDGYTDVYGYVTPTAGPTARQGIHVEIAWDKQTYSEVTSDVRPLLGGVSVEYGRDQTTALAPTISGRGAFTLDNRDRIYSPRNTASPLYGQIKPARPVKITRTTAASTYTLFVGHTDDSPINPDLNSRSVTLSLIDFLADLRGLKISTPLYRDLRTGTAIHRVLDAAGWPSNLRNIDPGSTVVPWWWEDDTFALEAIEKLLRAEGPPALLSVGPDGEIIFRDRHHRLTRAASITSQGTWRSTGPIEPFMQTGFTYDEAWRNIVNQASATVEVRQIQPLQVVWSSEETISLSDGESRTFIISTSDPFLNAIPPVSGVDFTQPLAGVLPGVISSQLLRTSGVSTTMILTSKSGPAQLQGLQLRAQPVTVRTTVQVSASDPESIEEYGSRAYPNDLPWVGVGDAEAIVNNVVASRSQPQPVVTARFVVGKNAARCAAILPRDLSDRVTVQEAETCLNDDFFIESIRHELTGEHDHSVVFGLEAARVPTSPTFRFDSAGFGFNDGKFWNGLDDAENVFRFDTAGHGFDLGVFAQ